jgi:YidC/Oxa1 family membrane protein insertase
MNIFAAPFINALFAFYHLFGSFGWAVIAVTIVIRLLLIPLVLPSLKSAKAMQKLQPKLKEIQAKYKGDKNALAKAQMDLYKKEGVNPLSGCLPQILQIVVLIIFFSAFNMVTNYAIGKGDMNNMNSNLLTAFKVDENFKMNLSFFNSTLTDTPGSVYKTGNFSLMILPVFLLLGSSILQFLSSKLMMPAPKVGQALVKATKDKEDDMMGAMRTQSLYLMPLMTIFIGWGFNLGILLYWFVNSGVMLIQQLIVSKEK